MVCINVTVKNKTTLTMILISIAISWMISGIVGAIPGLRSTFIYTLCLIVVFVISLITPNVMYVFLMKANGWLLLLSLSIFIVLEYYLFSTFQWALTMIFPIALVFCSLYIEHRRSYTFSFTKIFFLSDIIFKIIVTFYFLRIDELICKKADHIGFTFSDGITRTVMGYSSIYMLPPLLIVLLEWLKISKKKRKPLILIYIALCLMIIFYSQISMAIFAMSAIISLYFLKMLLPKKTNLIYIAIAFACSLYIFRVPILEFMSGLNFLGDTVLNRISGLLTVMQNDIEYVYSSYTGSMVEGDSVVNRFYSYSESFKAMFHNFFLGDLTPNAYAGAGHSMVIDWVSRYGIFPVAILISFIYKRYKNLINRLTEHKTEIRLIMIYFLAVGILNNISLNIVFLFMYVIIPVFFSKLNSQGFQHEISGYE